MPRYYFHIRRQDVLEEDRVGIDCKAEAAARAEAFRRAHTELRRNPMRLDDRIVVCDEHRRTVIVVPFADTLRAPGGT